MEIHPAVEECLREGRKLRIDIGCGEAKRGGHLGMDRLPLAGVDIVADANEGLGMIPDNSVDEIYSHSLLEHLDSFELIMSEMHRVVKAGGVCNIFVPHFSNPWYYSDYTHKRFFGLYTFYYFVPTEKQLRRKVPAFYTDTRIEILSLKLIFSHSMPFKLQKKWRRIYTWIFNRSTLMQEYYESSLTGIIPCYGIRISFRPIKD